jgi:hypothetical protein
MKKYIFILICILSLVSCKPKQLITTASQKDSINIIDRYIDKFNYIAKDSINIRDSIVIRPDGSINRYHAESRNKYREISHWIRINKQLFHTLTITKTVAVQAKLKWYDRIFIFIGRIVSISFLVLLLFVIVKYYTNPISYLKNLLNLKK